MTRACSPKLNTPSRSKDQDQTRTVRCYSRSFSEVKRENELARNLHCTALHCMRTRSAGKCRTILLFIALVCMNSVVDKIYSLYWWGARGWRDRRISWDRRWKACRGRWALTTIIDLCWSDPHQDYIHEWRNRRHLTRALNLSTVWNIRWEREREREGRITRFQATSVHINISMTYLCCHH